MNGIWRESKTKEEIVNSDQKQTREPDQQKQNKNNQPNREMDGKNMPEGRT